MKRLLLSLAFASLSLPALAQQPPQDPVAATYRQLLTEANDRIVTLAAQAQRLETEKANLAKQLEEAKKAADKPK